MSSKADQIAQAIPARFVMLSGSEDAQTSADVSNVNTFELPNPAGRAGGACTSTLLSVLNNLGGQHITWIDLLRRMREVLRQKGFDQVPQLSSSRMIDVNHAYELVPPSTNQNGGAKRAILIGINYVGQKGQLSGCHNDVANIKDYLIRNEGFAEKDMLILMDDGKYHNPTRRNIEDAFRRICQYSKPHDCVFIHYSGHGGRVPDRDGDESDGYDETLIPVDFKSAGQIVDDDILKMLVKPMPAGVNVTVLMDCCHSGTVLDLPYAINATESQMHSNDKFNMGMLDDVQSICCIACLGLLLGDILGDFL
eukprot:CAMPEP_0119554570 /NCGR_PEP_ID=MMETSP1352-20130426/7028_1 /TAXON_ID=265584 /ORGANISM="Stauroneis constricta, Strain CCMP1120" /LENGTH=308 /DNA_ID=CAMNT_0007601183 /DNA_START=15 /DNA_END=941 /DNA_ORIENTATION=+